MKRLFTTAVCSLALFCAALPAQAQSIGFKLGMTSSKFELDPDDEGEQDRLNQFGGGGFVRFGLGALTLQAEVLALTKGAQASIDDDQGNVDGKIKLDYIEVPVTAMFSFGNGPYIFAGPALAFETGCSLEGEVGNVEFEADCDDEDTDFFNRKSTDFGVTAGLGFQFQAGPGAILIEGRHTWGLTNLNDDDTDSQKVNNRSFAIFAGYAIGIGGR
jgi:hypothetical protein